MRRLIGVLALAGGLLVAAGVPNAAAQYYGPGLGSNTWYGPFVLQGSGPYGGIGATGFGSQGYGCGQGAYGFSNYGYGLGWGIGNPMLPTCGGFGNWPYLYPFTTGYPYTSGTTPLGAMALGTMANTTALFGSSCGGLLTGSSFPGQSNVFSPGANGQFTLGNNANLLNISNPGLATQLQVGTFGSQNVFGCVTFP
ncbi:MAG TPA: hypothetical protein VII06_17455 [Chloroflexota bacterium]|jgi:hypothetical protein